jgi:transcription elongation factor GreB
MSDKNYITPEGFESLRREYQTLLNEERPKLLETIAWAASNGDRSENADYIYGKKRLREIDRRLRFLTKRMDSAQIVDPGSIQSQRVLFGATVTLLKEDGDQVTYRIVGEDESDLKRGQISWKSPVAQALLGRQEGDEVLIRKPQGEDHVEILRIQFLAK